MFKGVNSKDIYILCKHSDLNPKQTKEILKDKALSDKGQWIDFIYYFLAIFGFGLLLSAVVFFFAFNWQNLAGFTKFGILIALLLVCIFLSIYTKSSTLVKNLSLLGASSIIGILFAVFGQVYQTGANAYDLFLMWSLGITGWTLVSKFSFQWLFYVVLANTTLILWIIQVSGFTQDLEYGILCVLALNAFLLFVSYLHSIALGYTLKNFYSNILSFVLCYLAVMGISNFIFLSDILDFSKSRLIGSSILLVASIAWLITQRIISFKTKSITKYSFFLVSIVICFLLIWVRIFDLSILSSLLYSVYCILAIVFLIKTIGKQLKIWKHEQ